MSDQSGSFESVLSNIVRHVVREELRSHAATETSASISTLADGEREYLTVSDAAKIAGLHSCTM